MLLPVQPDSSESDLAYGPESRFLMRFFAAFALASIFFIGIYRSIFIHFLVLLLGEGPGRGGWYAGHIYICFELG